MTDRLQRTRSRAPLLPVFKHAEALRTRRCALRVLSLRPRTPGDASNFLLIRTQFAKAAAAMNEHVTFSELVR
jgi:hypothetical protein